jgi:non-homologous end joining protein Ku
MVAIAEAIIERRSGALEAASFWDRIQDALRELVEAKTKGLEITPRVIAEPRDYRCVEALPKNN